MARIFDPKRLDLIRFSEGGATLSGEWPLASLERVASLMAPPAEGETGPARAVSWVARGERRAVAGEAQVWVDLEADADMPLTCQRCLGVVNVPVSVRRAYRFVADEASAEALDADTEDDVLVISAAFNLRALIEDELLLHLPLVPKHEPCPASDLRFLPPAHALPEADPERENPFAVLAPLLGGKLPN